MSTTKLKKNAGVSIAELMVYIVLGLIVVGFALNAMTDMAKGYTRSRTVMKMQKDGRDAVQVMAREIANTGFKYYIHDTTVEVTNTTTNVTTAQTVYTTRPTRYPVQLPNGKYLSVDSKWLLATYCGAWNRVGSEPAPAADSAASFRFSNQTAGNSDTLTIYSAILNARGNGLAGISKISYFLSVDTLIRAEFQANKTSLNNSNSTAATVWGNPTRMALMDKVAGLQFQFSENGASFSPTTTANRNHLVKMIKIQLVAFSDKNQKDNLSPSVTIGDLPAITNTNTGASGKRLLRLYEKIVEIPNNGVLID